MKLDDVFWQEDFSQTYHRGAVGWPVDPIYISAAFRSPIVRVYCKSDTARSSWRVAGELVQVIGDYKNPDFEGQAMTVPLNAIKLVEFSPTVTDYSLKFIVKPWIESFELKIESPLPANSP